jgi:transcriptional regulator with XRE-family HTH domain
VHPDPESLPIGKQLKLARVAADLTSTEVAKAVDISIGHLSRIEKGERTASPDLIARIEAVIDGGKAAVA